MFNSAMLWKWDHSSWIADHLQVSVLFQFSFRWKWKSRAWENFTRSPLPHKSISKQLSMHSLYLSCCVSCKTLNWGSMLLASSNLPFNVLEMEKKTHDNRLIYFTRWRSCLASIKHLEINTSGENLNIDSSSIHQ